MALMTTVRRNNARMRFALARNVARRKQAAFTLVELLVVVAVIAILAAILWPVLYKLLAKVIEALRRTPDFFKYLISRRISTGLAIGVPLLIILWHVCAISLRPRHLDEIVAELGSTINNNFYRDPMPNNKGERIVYIKSSENGFGVYFVRIGDSHSRLLSQEAYSDGFPPNERLLGWSPDDKLFAYGQRQNYQWEIVICDGDSGNTVATVPLDRQATSGIWISPETLVFAMRNTLSCAMISQKKWPKAEPFGCFRNGSYHPGVIKGLMAIDNNSVIWQQGNAIFTCDENSPSPKQLWASTTDNLLEFAYSTATERLLLHCQNSSGQFLVEYCPFRNNSFSNVTEISADEYNPKDLAFINDGKGYAFLSQIQNMFQVVTNWNTLVIKPDDSHDFIKYQWPNQIRGFAAGQHRIFMVTSLNDGPKGICKYDLTSGSVECVVPNTDAYLDYSTNYDVKRNQITNSSGEILTYYLYAPPHSGSGKKCPLILGILGIGPPGFEWQANHEAFANCGYYYAYVERYNRPFYDTQWGDDVLTVYDSLVKNFSIDTNKVYLYGVSAGASAVYELLQNKPELWRGAVLFSPAGFPDPSQIPRKRIFVDIGDKDESPEIVKRFVDKAAITGTPVTLMDHPGLGHIFIFPPAERGRLREALIFLNEP